MRVRTVHPLMWRLIVVGFQNVFRSLAQCWFTWGCKNERETTVGMRQTISHLVQGWLLNESPNLFLLTTEKTLTACTACLCWRQCLVESLARASYTNISSCQKERPSYVWHWFFLYGQASVSIVTNWMYLFGRLRLSNKQQKVGFATTTTISS